MRPRCLSAAIVALVLTLTPSLALVSNAQAGLQAGPGQASQGRSPAKPRMNFTPAQQQQFQAIRQRTREQINAVLTPEQRAQIESHRRGEPINLNLSEAQQRQIHAIRLQARQEMDALLTPEQRQLRDEMQKSQHWGRRGHRGQGLGVGPGAGMGPGVGPSMNTSQ
ncbi:hypothetical protein [Trichothermofontia sp.]